MATRARKTSNSSAGNIAGAGAAGGGIGTVIAALANGLPATSPWKYSLSVSSPLIAVAISGLWLFVKTVYIDPFVSKRRFRTADETMAQILADARTTAKATAEDPNASNEHKQQVRKMVEDLEELRMRKIAERMEVVAQE